MLHYSKFSLFALLAFICAAVSGCTTTNYLSSDPKTAEDILRASMEHEADVTLVSGETINYCYAITIRKDSTRWQLTEHGRGVSVPTASVASIKIATPSIGTGILAGVVAGALVGVVIGTATENPNSWFPQLQVVGAAVSGLLLGGIAGGIIGGNYETVWTRNRDGSIP